MLNVKSGDKQFKKVPRMIGLVDEYKFILDNFSWKYRTILSKIPNPKERNLEQSSASSSRTSSLKRRGDDISQVL